MKTAAPSAMTPRHARRHAALRPARGAATLIVVMLLFFVVSLAAAYASRNLIFEQRTAANQQRSTQVIEAAEAGLEWAQLMLNGGRVDASCLPTNDVAFDSFRQRYLNVNAANGVVSRKLPVNVWAACSFNGTGWSCKCPTAALAAADVGEGRAAFAVRFTTASLSTPGVIRIDVNGCTSNALACLTFVDPSLGVATCRTTLCQVAALFSGAKAVPLTAITARQDVGGTSLQAVNADVTTGGIAIHAGGAVAPAVTAVGMAGSPRSAAIRASDAALGGLAADAAECIDCLFSTMFGLRPDTYRRQAGVLELDCGGGCTSTDVNTALDSLRGRMLWLRGAGGLTIDDPASVIGAANAPVAMVVDGPLTMAAAAGSGVRVYGLVYAQSAVVDGGSIQGALISASTVSGDGTGAVVYDGAVLSLLQRTVGTFVRVPGGWRDFP